MAGEVEINICSVCNTETQVNRKYYHYQVKCECCNGPEDDHFEIVYHCNNCEPNPPSSIKEMVKPLN